MGTDLPNMGNDHICLSNIIQTILVLPRGKATGLTGIPNEALNLAVYPFSILLEKMFNFIWNSAIIPQTWKEIRNS